MNFFKNISKEEWLIGGAVALVAYLIFSKKIGSRSTKKAFGILNSNKYQKYGTDVLSVARAFEPLATGGYRWKDGRGVPSTGMPLDIYFKSTEPIFKKPADGSTYCTGYTFAVAFTVALNRGLLNDFNEDDIKKMWGIWIEADGTRYPKMCVKAIAEPLRTGLQRLGKEVTLQNAKEGDFCQIWRTTGTTHQAILVEKIIKNGAIVGIKYLSSNPIINPDTKKTGIGLVAEFFNGFGGDMLIENTYFARLNENLTNLPTKPATISQAETVDVITNITNTKNKGK
jgi:hypothetical protein